MATTTGSEPAISRSLVGALAWNRRGVPLSEPDGKVLWPMVKHCLTNNIVIAEPGQASEILAAEVFGNTIARRSQRRILAGWDKIKDLPPPLPTKTMPEVLNNV